jgi:hypothetical protein
MLTKKSVYLENHEKPINTLCEENEELMIVETGGTYSYHCGFKPLDQCFPNCASRLPGEARNYVRGGVKKL